jgi:NitT/TauT family transport system substrate-binding protein
MRINLSGIVTAFLLLIPALAAAQDQELVIGAVPATDVPHFAVASEAGLFAEQGLELQEIPFASGREAFEALIGGQLDLAVMAEFPAVVGAMREQEFGIVALLSRYGGTRIITKGSEPLASVADLEGKRIGATIGTNTHYMLDRELARAGISAEIVNVGPPDIVPALVRGDIDAAVPFPSFYDGAKRTLEEEYQELRIQSYGTNFVIAATQELIDSNPEAIEKLLRAMVQAEAIIEGEPAKAQDVVAEAARGAQSAETIKANWQDYDYSIVLDRQLLELLTDEGRWIADLDLIKDVEPTEALFRDAIAEGPLQTVEPGRVTLD